MSLVDLFGGLTQGFGSTYLTRQQEERARQDGLNKRQYEIFHDAFKTAIADGDDAKAIDALNSMKPLLGGKPGKPHLLDFMIKSIETVKPKMEKGPTGIMPGGETTIGGNENAQAGQGTVELYEQPSNRAAEIAVNKEGRSIKEPIRPLIGRGMDYQIQPPSQGAELVAQDPNYVPESPGIVTQKGYFKTPEERAAQETKMIKQREEALLPLAIKKYDMQRDILGREAQELEDKRIGGRKELEDKKQEGRMEIVEGKAAYKATEIYNKYLALETQGDLGSATPEQRQRATDAASRELKLPLDKIQAGINYTVRKTKELDDIQRDRLAKIDLRKRDLAIKEQNYSSLSTYRSWLQQNGDVRTVQNGELLEQKFGEAREKIETIKRLREENRNLIPQITQQHAIANNMMLDEEQQKTAKQNIINLEAEYKSREAVMDVLEQQLSVPTGRTIKSSSTTDKTIKGQTNKVMNKKVSPGNDPLGIR